MSARTGDAASQAGQRISVEHERQGELPGCLDPRPSRRAGASGRANHGSIKPLLSKQFGKGFRRRGLAQHDGGDVRGMNAKGVPVTSYGDGSRAIIQRGCRGKA